MWLGMGYSLGWYYTFTYYGHAGWPMPLMDACAAIILYYFSVLNVATEIQAVHWMIVFPAAGALWTGAIWYSAPKFGLSRPRLARWVLQVSLGALPIVLAGPPMAAVAAHTESGLSAQRMIDVALRHGFVNPAGWLTPLYFSLGLCGAAWQFAAYRRTFSGSLYRSFTHLLTSAVLTVITACVVGAVVGLPLRLALE